MSDVELSGEDLALLSLLASGRAVDSIARELEVSPRTVRRRCRALCDRLCVGTPVEAVAWAARRGLV